MLRAILGIPFDEKRYGEQFDLAKLSNLIQSTQP